MDLGHLDDLVDAASDHGDPLCVAAVLISDPSNGGDGFRSEFAILCEPLEAADLLPDHLHARVLHEIDTGNVRLLRRSCEMLVGLREEDRHESFLAARHGRFGDEFLDGGKVLVDLAHLVAQELVAQKKDRSLLVLGILLADLLHDLSADPEADALPDLFVEAADAGELEHVEHWPLVVFRMGRSIEPWILPMDVQL